MFETSETKIKVFGSLCSFSSACKCGYACFGLLVVANLYAPYRLEGEMTSSPFTLQHKKTAWPESSGVGECGCVEFPPKTRSALLVRLPQCKFHEVYCFSAKNVPAQRRIVNFYVGDPKAHGKGPRMEIALLLLIRGRQEAIYRMGHVESACARWHVTSRGAG